MHCSLYPNFRKHLLSLPHFQTMCLISISFHRPNPMLILPSISNFVTFLPFLWAHLQRCHAFAILLTHCYFYLRVWLPLSCLSPITKYSIIYFGMLLLQVLNIILVQFDSLLWNYLFLLLSLKIVCNLTMF